MKHIVTILDTTVVLGKVLAVSEITETPFSRERLVEGYIPRYKSIYFNIHFKNSTESIQIRERIALYDCIDAEKSKQESKYIFSEEGEKRIKEIRDKVNGARGTLIFELAEYCRAKEGIS